MEKRTEEVEKGVENKKENKKKKTNNRYITKQL